MTSGSGNDLRRLGGQQVANISDQMPQDVDKHLSETTLHTGLPAARNPYDVEEIAERIKERDRLAIVYAHAQWLENGRDLLRAKSLLDHGSFENWCRQT